MTCRNCELAITTGHAYELGEESRWHIDCFKCYKCKKKLTSESDFLVLSTGALVCYDCSDSCTICGCKIDELAIILSNSDEAYCRKCFKCTRCNDQITNLRYAKTKRGLYCIGCHETLIEKRKLVKQQQQQNLQQKVSSSSIRKISAAGSDASSEFDNSRVSTYIEATDISRKAKEKLKKLPTVPSPELRKRREEFGEIPGYSSTSRTASPLSELFDFRQPPDLQQKPRITSSDSSLNLSAHTTAENSPMIPQQGAFALRSYETLLKKPYVDNSNKSNISTLKAADEATNIALSPPMRSPKREHNDSNNEAIYDDFDLRNSSFEPPRNVLGSAPAMSYSPEPLNFDIAQQDTHQALSKAPVLGHMRTLSQQQPENSSNPTLLSPTVLGKLSVRSTPTISQNGFANSNTSSKLPVSAKKNGNHSRKPSIDDVLAATLKTSPNFTENDMFLNKTPLKNSALEEEELSHESIIYDGKADDFMDNQQFLDDENIQMALKMRNEISPQKPNTFPSPEEFITASNSRHDLQKSFNENSQNENTDADSSSAGTPKKLGRSLSFKSPKKFFHNLTKSPGAGNTHKRNDSTGIDTSATSLASENLPVPPLPTDILTSKQQQKIESQTGSAIRHRKTSSNGSLANKMYSANHTMPLSEQTLMDGQQAKLKLNQMFKSAGISYANNNESKRIPSTSSNHQRSTSASSALQRSMHSRNASLDYMNNFNNNNRDVSGNSGLEEKTTNNDFEGNSGENFQFGTTNPASNSGVNETMLQLRKLKLEIYNLENTKRILNNEVESLSSQKSKLLIEISDLNNNLKSFQNAYTKATNANANQSQNSLTEESYRKKSIPSSINSVSSIGNAESPSTSTNNYNNNNSNTSNNSSKPRFWKSIFQTTDKNHSSNKSIDKSSIKMSSSVSQPLLNTLIGSQSSNNLSIFNNSSSEQTPQTPLQSELIKIEAKYNNVLQDDIDAYSITTNIALDGKKIRDYSLIGFCKMEKHSGIPFIIRFFIDFMQNKESFMRQEGVYRKAASKTLIEQFESLMYEKHSKFINSSKELDYGDFYKICSDIVNFAANGAFLDVHLLCSCFKRFLRRLLVPVIPFTKYFDLVNDNSSKVILPKEHEQTLALIVNHLKHVTNLEKDNKMSKYNLALVFAPSLIRDLNNEREMLDFKERVKYIEFLLM